MVELTIDSGQLRRLTEATKKAGKDIIKELSAAINETARKTQTGIGKDVRELVAIPVKESKRVIDIRDRASPRRLRSTVRLRKTPRLGLRHFGARQDRRGVSYRIDKTKGRQRIDGGFQGPRPGVMKVSWRGNVFVRLGKARLPIVKVNGVSAWGVYTKKKLTPKRVAEINQTLHVSMERRIRLNILRANKLVNT